jgi:sugar phosphate permease
MMKLQPTWIRPARAATVAAALSLSYVAGGVVATVLAGAIKSAGGGWRAIMGGPSLVLVAIAAGCALVVRPGPLAPATPVARGGQAGRGAALRALLVRPQFLIVCALSFALTLMRESFNTWSVDFLESVGGTAFHSTTFDLAGAPSILLMGILYDRAPPPVRRWLVAGVLALLTALLFVLAGVRGAAGATFLIGAVGLLVYGPYSLLAGVLAIESGGAEQAATASGIIDCVGYGAGYLAGEFLGGLLDRGGYALGFRFLGGVTAAAALIALGLRPRLDARRAIGQ